MESYAGMMRSLVGKRCIFVPGVRALILDNEGRILLQLRSDTGCWGLPGGSVEIGETALDALRREVLEETGLTVVSAEPMALYSGAGQRFAYPNGDEVSASPLTSSSGNGMACRVRTESRAHRCDPGLCDPSCDRCLFGCRRGAKWTSRDYLYEAAALGARVITRCDVRKVIRSGNCAAGVLARTPEGTLVAEAGRVILAAGGLGTPMILHASGVKGAGTYFFTDPMSVLAGLSYDGKGTWHEITYTFADESRVGEFVMGNVGAVNAFMAQIAALHLPYARRIAQLPSLTGMFVKLCDEPSGRIEPDGTLLKAFTPRDEKIMAEGVDEARKIMVRAGVIPETISVAKGIGGHPGGTAAIGRVVDKNLMTGVENLYVCDNSVMPRSGGIPPVLTLIALGKRFARSLIGSKTTGKGGRKK